MTTDISPLQHVRSSVADLAPRFDRIVHSFFDRYLRQCPRAKKLVPPAGRRTRYELANTVSGILKHLPNLDGALATFARLSQKFAAAGLTAQEIHAARMCLLASVREAAGKEWTPQLESAWNHVLHDVFARLTGAPVQTFGRRAA